MKKRLTAIVLIITLLVGLFNHSGLYVSAGEIQDNPATEVTVTEVTATEPQDGEAVLQNDDPEAGEIAQYEDMEISSNYTLSENLEVGNLTIKGGETNLNGYTITVHGEVSVNSGALKFNTGNLICEGDFTYSSGGLFTMNSVNDYLYVGGDFVWNRGNCRADNGVIEIKGNFYDNGTNGYGFKGQGNNTVIFSGAAKQTVVSNSQTVFGIVDILNYHPEGVYSELVMVAQKIRTNGLTFSYPVAGVKGWTLEADETFEGDLLLVSDELDLNGHTLTIEGSLIQMSGNVNVNGGKLIVNGDYRNQYVRYTEVPLEEDNEGNGEANVTLVPEYSYGGGSLLMTNEADEVWVAGDFVMNSMQDHTGRLVDGKLYVAGDFIQIKASEKNFAASDNHRTILNGEEAQGISFESPGNNKSCFAGMELKNTSEEGVTILTDAVVIGEACNTGSNVTGYITIYNKSTFKDNYYKGDVKLGTNYNMASDLNIAGNLYAGFNLYHKGYTLTVEGDIEVYNSFIQLAGGTLECKGNLNVTSGTLSRSYINMTNANDYVLIHGDVNWSSGAYTNNAMTAGILEIKGDFTQNVVKYENNFMATGSHKVILSGDAMQTVTFNSNKSFFNVVELKNTSPEGIYCPQYFNFTQIIKNGCNITYEGEGTYGWALEADEVIEGDMHLVGDELNLNGHELVIEGNLIHEAGTININGGTLVIKGDYRLQTMESEDTQEAVYSPGSGTLLMVADNDKVQVEGDFIMDSVNDHTDKLTNGKLYIAGDFVQMNSSEKNFAASGNHQTIFNGTDAQDISFESPAYNKSYFANLVFENTATEGVTIATDGVVTGELANTQSVITGYVTLYRTGTLKENYYKGDVVLNSEYQIRSDMNIDGSIYVEGNLYFNGHKLTVGGNTECYNAYIRIAGGSFECKGDVNITSSAGSRSYILMTNANDYVLIHGNLNWSSAVSNTNVMTAGTMEIKGDFTQTVTRDENNFTATGTHKVILSGDGAQTITFNSEMSYFNVVELNNTSLEGIYCPQYFTFTQLIKNGCKIVYEGSGTYGWTLEADEVFEGDMHLVGDELNLNGHELVIEGNLIHEAGTININNGRLIVKGDYRLQSMEDDNGSNFGQGNGILVMTGETDEVHVQGSFIMGSIHSHKDKLTNGKLYISGDFKQVTYSSNENFSAETGHETIFNGPYQQVISFDNGKYNESHFGGLTFANDSAEGIVLATEAVVTGALNNPDSVVTGAITLHTTGTIKDNYYNGDLKLISSRNMTEDWHIGGNLRFENYILLKGHNLIVDGDVDIYNSYILLGGGRLECKGNLNVSSKPGSRGYVYMNNAGDYVIVWGNVNWNSCMGATNMLTAGTMEIKGDFTQIVTQYEDNFTATGSHKVIFSGDKKQTITINSAKSYFNMVEFTNTSAEGIYVTGEMPAASLVANGVIVTFADNSVLGWTLDSDMIIDEKLVMNSGVLDLNGYSLTINGDLIQKGGSVTVNGGSLKVNGDYRIQSVVEAYDGSVTYDYSAGSLTMQNANDSVVVTGDFVTSSVVNHTGLLTDGVLEVKGNFVQNTTSVKNNFVAEGTHVLKLTGNAEQNVTFVSTQSAVANLVIDNSSEEGVVITGTVPVKSSVSDISRNVTGDIQTDTVSAIADSCFSGGVVLSGENKLSGNLSVGGTLTVNETLDVNGFILAAGGLEINEELIVNGGQINCGGDMNVKWYGSLVMTNEADTVIVDGSFTTNAGWSQEGKLTAGMIEVRRDFIQEGSTGSFVATGSHKTVLYGRNYKQTIIFESPDVSGFNTVVITRPDRYYYFNPALEEVANEVIHDIRDIDSPAQVTGLIVTGTTASSVDLIWNATTDDVGVTGYEIHRDGMRVATSNTAKFTDEGLLPESTYTYCIVAFDEAGNKSAMSDKVNATTEKDTENPTVPTELTVVRRSGSSITLRWNPATDNVGCAGYKVYRNDVEIAYVSEANTYKDPDALFGEEYTYKVQAVDTSGNESDYSESVTGYVVKPKLTAIEPGDATVIGGGETITIKAKFADSGNSIGNKVAFEYTTDMTNWYPITEKPCEQQVISVKELYAECRFDTSGVASGEYVIRATLYDEDGNTDSEMVTYVIDNEAPGVITDLRGESVNGCNVLTWTAVNTGDLKEYRIYRKSENGSAYALLAQKDGREITEYYDNSVIEGTTYEYYVTALDTNKNESMAGNLVTLETTRDEEAPVVLKVTMDKEVAIQLTTVTVEATDNLKVKEILLQYYDEANDLWVDIGRSKTTKNQAVIEWDTTDLTGSEYTLRAIAWDGNDNRSEDFDVTVKVDNVGPGKINVTEAVPFANYVSIRWEDVADEDLAYFAVEMVKGELSEVVGTTEDTLGYHVTGLRPETQYTLRVVGYDTLGNRGTESEPIVVTTTEDMSAPYIKTFGPAESYYGSSIPFVVEAQDNCSVKEIVLEYSYDNENWQPIITMSNDKQEAKFVAECEYATTELVEGEVYCRAVAYDYSNNISAAVVNKIIIDRTSPATANNLLAKDISGCIELTWNVEDEDISYYIIHRSKGDNEMYVPIENKYGNRTYYDNNVQPETTYAYKIQAVDIAGNISELSNVAVATVSEDFVAPEIYGFTPEDGSNMSNGANITVLVYDSCLESVLVEYREKSESIWYTLGIDTEFTDVLDAAEFEWDTTALKEGEYEFRAIAKDENHNTSSASVTYYLDTTAPAKPVMQAEPGNSCIKLSWNASECSDFEKYVLLRKSALENDYKIITTLTEESYTDKDVDAEVIYSYILQSYDMHGNYSESIPVSSYAFDVDEEDPVAILPTEIIQLAGVEFMLDGTQSTDNRRVVSYEWNMGNGDVITGICPHYTYYEEGVYTVKLKVTDPSGNTDETSMIVKVYEGSNYGRKDIYVRDQNNNPVPFAYVYFNENDSAVRSLMTDGAGKVTIVAEPGTWDIAVYKQGYTPQAYTISVDYVGENPPEALYISSDDFVITDLKIKRMTLAEMAEAGIDFKDPSNYNLYKFEVYLEFLQVAFPIYSNAYDGISAGGNNSGRLPVTAVKKGNNSPPSTLSIINSQQVILGKEEPIYEIITVRESVSWLKDIYQVDLSIINSADYQFALVDSMATIWLPDGLDLCAMNVEQSAVQEMGTIQGGTRKDATWYISGSEMGTYTIEAFFEAQLMPFGVPISVDMESSEFKVEAGEGIKILVMPEVTAYIGEDYYIQYKLTNHSSRTIYNLKTSFGEYEKPGNVTVNVGVDEMTGETEVHIIRGKTFRYSDVNECPSIPVLTGGETIEIGVLEPGQSVYGTYKTTFDGEGDPDKVYYVLDEKKIFTIFGNNLGVDVTIASIGSHIQKAVVRYTFANYVFGDPIDMTTGAFTENISLLNLKCDPAIDFGINYSSLNSSDIGDFGYGWSHDFEACIKEQGGLLKLYLSPSESVTFVNKNDMNREVTGTIDGDYILPKPAEMEAEFVTISTFTQGYTIKRNADGTYCFDKDGEETWDFDTEGRLVKITKQNGKTVEITRGGDYIKITEPESGMYIYANYNEEGLITQVIDNAGNKAYLAYENGCLTKITNAVDDVTSFVCDENHRIVKCYAGEVQYLTNIYDDKGRVIEQDDADTETPTIKISYEENEYGETITRATDRNGNVTTYYSNMLGQVTKILDPNGAEVTYTYNEYGTTSRETNGNGSYIEYMYNDDGMMIGMEDTLGNIIQMNRDSKNNITKLVTPNDAVTRYTYDAKNLMTSQTTSTGAKTTYTYDSKGRVVTEMLSGLGKNTYAYTNGLNTSITNYLGDTTRMTYDAVGNITSVTAADGTVTRYEYDALGRNTKIIYPDGGTEEYTYDSYNNIIKAKDQNGGISTFEYNANGWVVKSVNTRGGVTHYEYDNEGRITKTVNPDGSVAVTEYDAVGNVLKNIHEDGSVYTYTYDKANHVLSETAPDGGVTSYEYNLNGNLRKTTYPDGSCIIYTYDSMGNIAQSSDGRGNTYVYKYDSMNNLKEVKDPLGNVTSYVYDIYGRMTSQTDANGNTTRYVYDALGNCIRTTDPLGTQATMTYDHMSRLKTMSVQTTSGAKSITYEYDSMGRAISYTDEAGNVTKTSYDLMGNAVSVTDPLGNRTSAMTYDSSGNMLTATDALGRIYEYTYDAAGNVTKITSCKGTESEAADSYTYDALGRVKTATDAENGNSSYAYDAMGNITAVCDPNGGVTKYTYDMMGRVTSSENAVGSVLTYDYNVLGQLEKAVNARKQKAAYTYDALGRVKTVTDEAGCISYTYDKVGNVLEVKEVKADGTTNTIKRTYDALNRVVTYTDYRGETVKYGYDELGNVISLTYPGGEIVRYDYYRNGYLKSVTDWNNRVTNYEYDGNGRLKKQTRPDGTVETYVYDVAGQLLSQTDKKGDTVIQSITYEYDTAGNIVKTTQSGSMGDMSELTAATMEYDSANRLIKYNGEEVIYDADGNMTYGPLDGVMTEFTYDCRNRLIRADNTAYEYDAEDNRIAVQTDSTRTEYTVENDMTALSQVLKSTEYEVINDVVGETGDTTYYIYGNGLIAQENETYGYLTYHFNNIGSTTAITDSNGELLRVYTYGAYGELLSGDTTGISFLYNGQYGVITDKNNLYYMRARYYNVDIKRFINQDVLTGSITRSTSLNRYAYCEGNPVKLNDPFGLTPNAVINGIHSLASIGVRFVPVIGDIIEIHDGIRYMDQGQYGMAAFSFLCALPFLGDVAGAGVRAFTKCDKAADVIRYGARAITGTTVAAVGGYHLGTGINALIVKHVANGEPWDWESTKMVGKAALSTAMTVFSVKMATSSARALEGEMAVNPGTWCFVEGTKVHTEAGLVDIETVELGDYVLAYDEKTGETGYKKVVHLFRNMTDELAHLEVEGVEEIVCTPGHKFYVEGEWISAGKLENGDILTLADGTTTEVLSVTIEDLETPVIIYNFEVEDWHTYYVADEGVLVHNMKCENDRTNSKPINRPSSKKVKIDMEEVISGHTSNGQRAKQSQIKDLFPDRMSTDDIEKEIRTAYANAQIVSRPQFDGVDTRVKMQGFGNNGVVEMWYNKTQKIIETAYPVSGKKVKIK